MRRLAPLLLAVLTFAWCVRPMWDIDVWWHVATGRLILAGGIPTSDVFSAAHPDAPWTTFQWGYEALVAWVDGVWGLTGLRLVHAAAIAVGAGLLARGSTRPWVVGVLFWWLFEDRVRERPHVIEPIFIAALLPLLRSDRPRDGLFAVLLAPIWANLHAVSALWWVAIVGTWAVGTRRASAFGILALGIATMALSPAALDGLLAAFHSHSEWPAALVPELSSTWSYAAGGPWGWAMLAGVGLGLVAAGWTWRTGATLAERVVSAGCAVAACLLIRWAWLAVVPMVVVLHRRPVHAGWALLPLAIVGWHVLPRWSFAERLEDVQRDRFPVTAVDFMDEAGLRLPTDTMPEWSGYVLYHLYPPATVLSDGRLIFGPDVVELLLRRAQSDPRTFDEAVGRFHTLALLWRRGGLPTMEPTRWAKVWEDDVAELWLPRPAWTPERRAAIDAARARRGVPALE